MILLLFLRFSFVFYISRVLHVVLTCPRPTLKPFGFPNLAHMSVLVPVGLDRVFAMVAILASGFDLLGVSCFRWFTVLLLGLHRSSPGLTAVFLQPPGCFSLSRSRGRAVGSPPGGDLRAPGRRAARRGAAPLRGGGGAVLRVGVHR